MEEVSTDIQTIEQILGFVDAQGGMEKLIWCKAKVVDVILSSGWFMISCTTCFTKMKKNGETLTCRKCGPVAIGQLSSVSTPTISSISNVATEPNNKNLSASSGSDGQELKKRLIVRKNKSKVVTDESDEEESHVLVRANHTLEDDV
ncbi:unnamed protein product [Cochlearia groenlandica]